MRSALKGLRMVVVPALVVIWAGVTAHMAWALFLFGWRVVAK